mmetsp:Transcript_21608/g.44533  ORF Transcript_21608/g.44533 Transcript_21608/m.44533 type:complete len:104 (-) Transcript_21608:114-425(-)|eukprot:CAMPEP_0178487678 /NCGR_PEP_ID=MMETSP0696-20121128/9446_1 /TAXON_ID=265572 /ORGANISM="Extubocellulus spinifer, Strain CCMP396" /LENGTH=103 /DNA_ID=CAMNT_0020115379 /DNA_START=316 /DNA_END=627 /DNA_ORIENTATION=+
MMRTTFLTVTLVVLQSSASQSYEIGYRLRGIAKKIIDNRNKFDTESTGECPYLVGPCNRVMQNRVVCGEKSCEYNSFCEAVNSGFDVTDCKEIASHVQELPIP